MALTPTWKGFKILGLVIGFCGACSVTIFDNPFGNFDSYKGSPKEIITFPMKRVPICIVKGLPVDSTKQPAPTSPISPYGIKIIFSLLNPATADRIALFELSGVGMTQTSPIFATGP